MIDDTNLSSGVAGDAYLALKQAYAVGFFGEFRGAWQRGQTLWVGWWWFGLFLLHACELSGPGVVADRSVRTPASWVAR